MKRFGFGMLYAIVVAALSLFFGYKIGINKAMTSEGWVEVLDSGEKVFILEVDDNMYVWGMPEDL